MEIDLSDIKRLAEVCYQTFDTSTGKLFLGWMEQAYYNRIIYAPGMTFDQTTYVEGKRHVVSEIKDLIRMYRENDYPEDSYLKEDDEYGGRGN